MSGETCSNVLKVFLQQKCCYCVPLRIGCIILALLGIILGCFPLSISQEWPRILYAGICFVSGLPLIYGAIKYSQLGVGTYLLGWCIQMTVSTVITTFWLIYAFHIESYKDQLNVCRYDQDNCQIFVIAIALFKWFITGVNGYSFIVVMSFYVIEVRAVMYRRANAQIV